MAGPIAAVEPIKVALAVIAVVGIAPVAIQYRENSRWFAVGYGLLVVAALSTNLEDVFLPELMNAAEHAVGLMGAGIAFFAAAYIHRQRLIEEELADG